MGRNLPCALFCCFVISYWFSAFYDIFLRMLECELPKKHLYMKYLYDGYKNISYCEHGEYSNIEVRYILANKDVVDNFMRILAVALYCKYESGVYCLYFQITKDVIQMIFIAPLQITSAYYPKSNNLYYYPRIVQSLKYLDLRIFKPFLLFWILGAVFIITIVILFQFYSYSDEIFYSKEKNENENDNDDQDNNNDIELPPPYDEAIVIDTEDSSSSNTNNNSSMVRRSTAV